MFPGYAFVAYAPGVIGFLMDGERPARVPDAVIDELRARKHNGVIKLPDKPSPGIGFRVNDRLRIRTGPMRGLFGLYVGQAPHDRVKVLMQLLGSVRPVEFGIGDVIRA